VQAQRHGPLGHVHGRLIAKRKSNDRGSFAARLNAKDVRKSPAFALAKALRLRLACVAFPWGTSASYG
jgi:hypothetical protein